MQLIDEQTEDVFNTAPFGAVVNPNRMQQNVPDSNSYIKQMYDMYLHEYLHNRVRDRTI